MPLNSRSLCIASIPLDRLCGPGVIVDLSDIAEVYGIYTSKNIEDRVEVRDPRVHRVVPAQADQAAEPADHNWRLSMEDQRRRGRFLPGRSLS